MVNKKRYLYYQSGTSLKSFAEACFSLTPTVCLFREKELFLELGATQKYFGGESRLLDKADLLAEQFGVHGKKLVVDRPEWARAIATGDELYLAPDKSFSYLCQLPVERLLHVGDPIRLEEELSLRKQLVAFMRRVGIRSIQDFTRLDSAAIGRRFGKLGVQLHEWVTGQREWMPSVFIPDDRIEESIDCEETISLDGVLTALEQKLTLIEARLLGRMRLARKIALQFSLDSGKKITQVLVLSQPMREVNPLLKLFSEYLKEMKWDAPLVTLQISILDTEPFPSGQLSLFDDSESRFYELSHFVNRLRLRYGDEAVGFTELKESYLPERAWKQVWPPPNNKTTPPRDPIPQERPLFLFDPPRSCSLSPRWSLRPTENLVTEWWKPGGLRRYFIAETKAQEKLWLFWDGEKKEWFLQGTFD